MEQLLATVALTIYLLPCAIQDWRSHQISNWLTIPAFFVAYMVALIFNNLPFTLTVFLGCYVAWSMRWMGAADGKLATLVAAVAPSALVTGVLLLGLTFLILRLLRNQQMHLPAATWLWLACVLNAIVLSAQTHQGNFVHTWWLVALPKSFAISTSLFVLVFLYAKLRRWSLSIRPSSTLQIPTSPIRSSSNRNRQHRDLTSRSEEGENCLRSTVERVGFRYASPAFKPNVSPESSISIIDPNIKTTKR